MISPNHYNWCILWDNWNMFKFLFMSKPYLKVIHFRSPDSVILPGKNDSDRKFLCNFFAKNCSYKSFDVRTINDLILLINSKSITLKSFIELLLNKLLTCCNFPSIVVIAFQPRDAVTFSWWKVGTSFEVPFLLRWGCTK